MNIVKIMLKLDFPFPVYINGLNDTKANKNFLMMKYWETFYGCNMALNTSHTIVKWNLWNTPEIPVRNASQKHAYIILTPLDPIFI